MAFDFNSILNKGKEAAEVAKVKAKEAAKEGRRQVDLANAKNKLGKAERQLGALVYSLHINNEENPELVEKYIQAIADVEAEIAALNADVPADAEAEAAPVAEAEETVEAPAEEAKHVCAKCGAEMEEGALFCGNCGAQQ